MVGMENRAGDWIVTISKRIYNTQKVGEWISISPLANQAPIVIHSDAGDFKKSNYEKFKGGGDFDY